MRRCAVIVVVLLCPLLCGSGPKTVYVKGYTRKDGTYVQPHYRSAPGAGASSAPRVDPRLDPRSQPAATVPVFVPVPVPVSVPAPTPGAASRAVTVEPQAPKTLPPESPDDERERRARYKLKVAKDLLDQGDHRSREKAADTLHDLLAQYPGTKAAQEAQLLLKSTRFK